MQSLCIDIIGHFLSLNTSLSCYDTTFFSGSVGSWVWLSPSPTSSPAQINAPALPSAFSSLSWLSLWARPLAALNSGRWFPALPFSCQHPGESHRAAGHDFGTWWTVAQTVDKRVRQVTLTMVLNHPTSPLVFLPASKIPVLYSFLIKPVQQKSWLLYTVTLMF